MNGDLDWMAECKLCFWPIARVTTVPGEYIWTHVGNLEWNEGWGHPALPLGIGGSKAGYLIKEEP